jgi:branched-subunit amino acid aminotransferase/4-amino-4-deoxychorismate lyase
MPGITITYLNGPDVERLAMTDEEILAAVEGGLIAQGKGEAVIEPRTHLTPDPAFRGHFNVLRGYVAPLGLAGVKIVGDYVDNYNLGLPSEMALLNLFDPRTGIAELDRHLARLKRSADALDFAFDRHMARNDLQAATFRAEQCLVRLMLSRSGAIAIELRDPPPKPEEPVEVAVTPLPVAPDDFRLAHKTTDRAFRDEARSASGAFEILFRDESGFLTEGSFTNLFVERSGKLLTPPLSRGLLPGILRERLLEEGRAEEADLIEADLVHGFLIGNSARGLIRACLAGTAARHAM